MRKIPVIVVFFLSFVISAYAAQFDYKIGPILQHQLNESNKSAKPMSQKLTKVIVVIEADHLSELPPEIIAELVGLVESLGGSIGNHAFNNVQVWMPQEKIKQLAEWGKIIIIKTPTKPETMGIKSEGLGIGNILSWQSNGLTGTGVKVGVLDGGFKGADGLRGSELPADTASAYTGSTTDFYSTEHGTACAEIVHDVAPGAKLSLVNVADVEVDYSIAINWLKQQGVDIISSSIALNNLNYCYFIHNIVTLPSYYQDYVISQVQWFDNLRDQVNQAASGAVSVGITWTQAANNNGRQTWSGYYNDTDGDGWHNFSTYNNYNKFILPSYFISGKDVYVTLAWDLEGDGITNDDYDLYIYNDYGIVASSKKDQKSSFPVALESCKFTPIVGQNYYLYVNNYSATPQEIGVIVGTDTFAGLEDYTPEGTIKLGSPCENPDVITVGAVPYTNPFMIEDFSGQGPGDNGLIKPDIVAPDGVSTVSYDRPFFGTSAAAPYVAGVAALVKQKYPGYGPVQIKQYLESNAKNLGFPGKDNVYGSGLVQLPMIANRTDSTNFTTRFYKECLGRQPDQAGLTHWVDQLTTGTKTGEALAQSFIFSQEFINLGTTKNKFVWILYKAFFNREPDTTGYNNWVDKLWNGTDRATVLNGFTRSVEFINLCAVYGINPY